jgi:glucokinase
MKETTVRYAIGIDFGGTSVKIALVNEKGQIKARRKIVTKDVAGREAWLDAAAAAIGELRGKGAGEEKTVIGVGVGVPGFVDFDRGFIYDLPNVPGWTGVNLAERLEQRLGMRARIDNDVNAMALGECTFGAGRTYQHAVFVTLGTGVGGGLLINNQLYRGAYHMAGEIGHVPIDMNGVKTPTGRGGLEQYVGNRQIVAWVVERLKKGRPSMLRDMVKGDFSKIEPLTMQNAAEQGDALALESYDYMADCLATAFASVAYLIQPQAIIIGGGMSAAGKILLDPLRKHLQERLSPYFHERLEVKLAELGNDAGVIGSATLVMLD